MTLSIEIQVPDGTSKGDVGRTLSLLGHAFVRTLSGVTPTKLAYPIKDMNGVEVGTWKVSR